MRQRRVTRRYWREKKELEVALHSFCDSRKSEEFKDVRSKTLTNGKVYYRDGNQFVSNIVGTWDDVVALVQKSKKWAKSFLRVKIEINKSAVLSATKSAEKGKFISSADLEALGMRIDREEAWGYEPNIVEGRK